MSDWQPIDTAPTDGTSILAWAADWSCPAVMSREFYSGASYWEFREELISDSEGEGFPTHWMPIPVLP